MVKKVMPVIVVLVLAKAWYLATMLHTKTSHPPQLGTLEAESTLFGDGQLISTLLMSSLKKSKNENRTKFVSVKLKFINSKLLLLERYRVLRN